MPGGGAMPGGALMPGGNRDPIVQIQHTAVDERMAPWDEVRRPSVSRHQSIHWKAERGIPDSVHLETELQSASAMTRVGSVALLLEQCSSSR